MKKNLGKFGWKFEENIKKLSIVSQSQNHGKIPSFGKNFKITRRDQ